MKKILMPVLTAVMIFSNINFAFAKQDAYATPNAAIGINREDLQAGSFRVDVADELLATRVESLSIDGMLSNVPVSYVKSGVIADIVFLNGAGELRLTDATISGAALRFIEPESAQMQQDELRRVMLLRVAAEADEDEPTTYTRLSLISGEARSDFFFCIPAGDKLPADFIQQAQKTPSTIYINGVETAFGGYNIGGNNYFKLRDIAFAMNETDKMFSVSFDGETRRIKLMPGEAYVPAGGELMPVEDTSGQHAVPAASRVFVGDSEVFLVAYLINGNNYFKLRDMADVLGIEVTYDEDTGDIFIGTPADE